MIVRAPIFIVDVERIRVHDYVGIGGNNVAINHTVGWGRLWN